MLALMLVHVAISLQNNQSRRVSLCAPWSPQKTFRRFIRSDVWIRCVYYTQVVQRAQGQETVWCDSLFSSLYPFGPLREPLDGLSREMRGSAVCKTLRSCRERRVWNSVCLTHLLCLQPLCRLSQACKGLSGALYCPRRPLGGLSEVVRRSALCYTQVVQTQRRAGKCVRFGFDSPCFVTSRFQVLPVGLVCLTIIFECYLLFRNENLSLQNCHLHQFNKFHSGSLTEKMLNFKISFLFIQEILLEIIRI